MSKAGRNETKKVAAGFLNGFAIAVLVTGFLTPAFGQDLWALPSAAAVVLGLAIHALALAIVRRVED